MNTEAYCSTELRAHVEGVVLTYKTNDITGVVQNGHLDLRGKLNPQIFIPKLVGLQHSTPKI
jgi:hypothetical protein